MSHFFTIDYSLILYVFIIPLVVSLILTEVMRLISLKIGILDIPDDKRKIHSEPIPYLGGVAIYVSFVIGLIMFYYKYPNIFLTSMSSIKGIILGTVIIVLTGLIDDIYGMKYYWKLLGQLIAAIIVISYGVRLVFFSRINFFTYLFTIVWIIGITNSFNLLDNMNGLSAGIAAIASFFFAFIASSQQEYLVLIISIILAASVLGFLRHNIVKGNIFMGDTGSMLLGFVLSIISITGVYLKGSKLGHLPVIAPIIILGIPIFDTISVIVIRLKQHQSIFKADKQHFSHRLEKQGLSQLHSVIVIFMISFIMGASAVFLTKLNLFEITLVIMQNIFLLIIVRMLMLPSIRRREHNS